MINSVGQPVFREASEDRQRLQNIFRKLMRFTAFVSFPAMLGLAIVSQELIVISITEKWLPCVPVMQILCVWGAFMPISTLYSNLMNSIGRPNVYMWNTIALGIFQLLCVWGSYPYGLNIMLIVYTAANIFWLLIWHYFAHKHIGISLLNTLKDLSHYICSRNDFYLLGSRLCEEHLSFLTGENRFSCLTLHIPDVEPEVDRIQGKSSISI